jgi:uncharacterized protein YjiS (DUF1127 family)
MIRSPIFTAGYEGRVQDELLDRLVAAGVAVLLDVRAVPMSRKPGFSKRLLAASAEARGIRYVHLQPKRWRGSLARIWQPRRPKRRLGRPAISWSRRRRACCALSAIRISAIDALWRIYWWRRPGKPLNICKEGSSSFLKKRTKKLLTLGGSTRLAHCKLWAGGNE